MNAIDLLNKKIETSRKQIISSEGKQALAVAFKAIKDKQNNPESIDFWDMQKLYNFWKLLCDELGNFTAPWDVEDAYGRYYKRANIGDAIVEVVSTHTPISLEQIYHHMKMKGLGYKWSTLNQQIGNYYECGINNLNRNSSTNKGGWFHYKYWKD